MAIEVEDIVDRESFEEWLSSQPVEVSRLLAMRTALRTLPNVFSGFFDDDAELRADIAANLTLHSFRANFISWAVCKYPAPDMRAAVKSAGLSAESAADFAADATAYTAAFSARSAADSSSSAALTALSAVLTTNSATNSTVLTADSAALSAVWAIIRLDASGVLENGVSAVAASPLWPESDNQNNELILRNDAQDQISKFQQTEEYTALPWGLWVAWWENLQDDTSKSLFGEKADLEIALKPKEFWDRDADVVMGELAEIVGWPWGEPQAEIPPQQAAPIEAGFEDGKIVRQYSSHLQPTQGVPQIHALLLREAISMRDWISPQMAGAGELFDELIAELGQAVDETNIYGVGFWETSLQQFSQRVDEQFLEDNAARFAGLMINLDHFLKQSKDWQDYIKNVHAAELGGLDPEAAKAAVSEIVEAISDEEIVDESVATPLAQMKRALFEAQAYNPETTYGFYRSLANVVQVVAKMCLSLDKTPMKDYAGEVGDELRKKSKSWIATGILTAASAGLLYFAGKLPAMYGFLKPILIALGMG